MAKTAKEGFDKFIDRLVPGDTARKQASTHRAGIEAKLEAKFGIYRMFETGSLTHGTGVKGHSDVDFLVSLKSDKPMRSASILASVRDALKEKYPNTYIHVSRPAVVLDFGGGEERVEIIPGYAKSTVDGDIKYDIPGVVAEWLESTPRAHLQYVNDCNKVPVTGAAKGLARLAKAWKYYRDVPISSFYLEMRAAKYMAGESSLIYAHDLYRLLNELTDADLAPMNDPTGSTGRIYPCSSDANLDIAKSRLATALGRARRARDADARGDTEGAFAEWDLLFNGKFPAYY